MHCCQVFFRIILIILIVLDIGVGWYRFYQIFTEVEDIKEGQGRDGEVCSNVNLYWTLFLALQCVGTILDTGEIILVVREIYKDDPICKSCFKVGFTLIMLNFLLSLIPSTILSTIFQAKCVCVGTLSFDVWTVEITVFFKTFVGGLSAALFQVILHLTEIFTKFRRVCSNIGICRKLSEDETDNDSTLPYFVINIVLTVVYIVCFIVELGFLFCSTD